jgi:hypothetical protein
MTRTGLLIIRAWVEPGSSSPLRAQIRLTTDVAWGFERSLIITQGDAVMEAVQAWLADIMVGPHALGGDADRPER